MIARGDSSVDAGERVADMRACGDCLRRTWLIGALTHHLDRASTRPGAIDPVLECSDEDLIAALTTAGEQRRSIQAAYEAFEAGRARGECRTAGVDAVCRHDAGYPQSLLDLTAPPAVIHSRGGAQAQLAASRPLVAIVGARRASAYGTEVAGALARDLAVCGVTVVSGMALGVDSAAHAGALAGGGPTVAVLGGGCDVPYPASKRALYARILCRGVALSELGPGIRARRWSFPVRNRIIAALARLTVVVEAADRSGSLITARIARDLGRDVGAVPGRVTSRLAAGANELLRDGAHVIARAQDVLDLLYGVGATSVSRHREEHDVAERLRPVLRAVGDGADTIGRLAAAGIDADAAIPALAELELLGYLRRGAGGRYTKVL